MKAVRIVVACAIMGLLVAAVVALVLLPSVPAIDEVPFLATGLPGLPLGAAIYVAVRKLELSLGRFDSPVGAGIAACILLVPGSWALAVNLNVRRDDAPGETVHTTVLARPQETSNVRGQRETYHLELSPFLPEHGGEPVRFQVSRWTYRATRVGDTLELDVRPGRLGYRWLDRLPENR